MTRGKHPRVVLFTDLLFFGKTVFGKIVFGKTVLGKNINAEFAADVQLGC